MSDTPRTDEVEMHYRQVMEDRDAPMYLVPAAFAQGLEREVAALREALEFYASDGDWPPEYGLEDNAILLDRGECARAAPCGKHSSACTSEPFVCCGATGFRPCPTFEASCKNPANYGFPFARRVNAVLATRGLCLDASQLAALIQDPPTPHRAGAETYDEHRQNAIDDASRYEEAMAHALTNAFGLLRRVRDRVDAVQFFEADAAMKLLEEVMAARRMPHEECCGQGCAECQPPHREGSSE